MLRIEKLWGGGLCEKELELRSGCGAVRWMELSSHGTGGLPYVVVATRSLLSTLSILVLSIPSFPSLNPEYPAVRRYLRTDSPLPFLSLLLRLHTLRWLCCLYCLHCLRTGVLGCGCGCGFCYVVLVYGTELCCTVLSWAGIRCKVLGKGMVSMRWEWSEVEWADGLSGTGRCVVVVALGFGVRKWSSEARLQERCGTVLRGLLL